MSRSTSVTSIQQDLLLARRALRVRVCFLHALRLGRTRRARLPRARPNRSNACCLFHFLAQTGSVEIFVYLPEHKYMVTLEQLMVKLPLVNVLSSSSFSHFNKQRSSVGGRARTGGPSDEAPGRLGILTWCMPPPHA